MTLAKRDSALLVHAVRRAADATTAHLSRQRACPKPITSPSRRRLHLELTSSLPLRPTTTQREFPSDDKLKDGRAHTRALIVCV